jgi:glycine/D-amino acid oxidase-like deaminating enzyme
MSHAHVIIIGGGIVGSACAQRLAETGWRVTLIERDTLGSGATAAGMGQVVALDDSPAEFALTADSQRRWHALGQANPLVHEYTPCGTIWVASDDEELAMAAAKVPNYHAAGLQAELLDAAALYRHEPNLRPGLPGGLRIAGDAVVYPSRSAAWLWQQTGGTLIHAAVTAIHAGGVTLADGRHLHADAVVLATGSRARDLVPALPIRPKKGHLVITDRYPGFIHHQVAEMGYVKNAHLADVDSVAFNVQPRATGQILIGSCRQYDIHTPEVDPVMLGQMLQRCLEFMPALATLSSLRVWTGYRAATPDSQPLIGPHPYQPGLWLATGHEGLGITTSLGTADLLAALMNQTAPAIDPTPYLPSRFFAPTSSLL